MAGIDYQHEAIAAQRIHYRVKTGTDTLLPKSCLLGLPPLPPLPRLPSHLHGLPDPREEVRLEELEASISRLRCTVAVNAVKRLVGREGWG